MKFCHIVLWFKISCQMWNDHWKNCCELKLSLTRTSCVTRHEWTTCWPIRRLSRTSCQSILIAFKFWGLNWRLKGLNGTISKTLALVKVLFKALNKTLLKKPLIMRVHLYFKKIKPPTCWRPWKWNQTNSKLKIVES